MKIIQFLVIMSMASITVLSGSVVNPAIQRPVAGAGVLATQRLLPAASTTARGALYSPPASQLQSPFTGTIRTNQALGGRSFGSFTGAGQPLSTPRFGSIGSAFQNRGFTSAPESADERLSRAFKNLDISMDDTPYEILKVNTFDPKKKIFLQYLKLSRALVEKNLASENKSDINEELAILATAKNYALTAKYFMPYDTDYFAYDPSEWENYKKMLLKRHEGARLLGENWVVAEAYAQGHSLGLTEQEIDNALAGIDTTNETSKGKLPSGRMYTSTISKKTASPFSPAGTKRSMSTFSSIGSRLKAQSSLNQFKRSFGSTTSPFEFLTK